jgi:hypothetical protein
LTDRRGLVYALGVFALLGVALPLWAVPTFVATHAATSAWIAYIFVVYAAMRLAWLTARGTPALLDIAFWTFFYSFLSLPLLAQVTAGRYILGTDYSYNDATVAAAELVILAGAAGYEIGRVRFRRSHTAIEQEPAKQHLGISAGRALLIGYIGFLFVFVAIAQYGLASFFTSRDALSENFFGPAQAGGVKFYLNENKAGGALLQMLSQVPIFVGTYLLLTIRHAARSNPAIRKPPWLLIVPLIIGNIVINNPIANARFWFGAVAVAFVSIYLPLHKKGAVRALIVMFVAISLFSFTQLAAFRHTGAVYTQSEPLKSSLLDDPDYASPQQVMNGIAYVEANGYRFGRQLEGAVFVFVPRAIWTGKPEDTGQLVGGAAGFKVSAPVWTDGQVDFGLVGAFLYLLIIGRFGSMLDRRYRHRDRSRADLMPALTPILAGLLIYVLRGSLVPALGAVIPVCLFVAACAKRASRADDDAVEVVEEGADGALDDAPDPVDADDPHDGAARTAYRLRRKIRSLA